MTKRLNSATARLGRILCCAAAFLAGCASITESPDRLSQSDALPSLRISDQPDSAEGGTAAGARKWRPSRDATLLRAEIPDQPKLPHAIDLTADHEDLFQRIRYGFSMPELDDDLVLYHQQWYLNRPDYLRRMVDRSGRYLYYIVEELEKRGMPTELALLPMVESAYNPMAYSRSKASGLWQFIPATGKRYNLDQDWWKDERRDIVASTSAALDYLQSIYEMHGDWHLALASYNWGEGAVGRAIGKNRAQGLPTDYLSLTMPNETRNYVPKLQALKNIFRDPKLMASLDLPNVPNRPFFATVTTESHIDVKVAAKLAEMPVQEFVALNPAHNRPVIKPDTPLVIPAEKLETFVSNLEAHEDDNKPLSAWQTYTLQPGDKLEKIAPRFGMTVANLKAVNGIKGKMKPPPGLTLLVADKNKDKGEPLNMAALPEQPQLPVENDEPRGKTVTHSVRKGETLASLAKRYGTTVTELRKTNDLRSDKVSPGTKLKVQVAAAKKTEKTSPAHPAAEEKTASRSRSTQDSQTKQITQAKTQKPAESTKKAARYTVRRGDTIYSIARQFNVAADDLMRKNHVSADKLKPGTTLTIPAGENS